MNPTKPRRFCVGTSNNSNQGCKSTGSLYYYNARFVVLLLCTKAIEGVGILWRGSQIKDYLGIAVNDIHNDCHRGSLKLTTRRGRLSPTPPLSV